jgi:hypothetical protein
MQSAGRFALALHLVLILKRHTEALFPFSSQNISVQVPEGVKPDPENIAAITNMEKSTDVKGVQRLLGMANYLTTFLENLSDICEPIRKLTHKENVWNWTFEQDEAFKNLKEAVTKAPVLKYFDSKMEITLQCDASELGLGATLMQNDQPIATLFNNFYQLLQRFVLLCGFCNQFLSFFRNYKIVGHIDLFHFNFDI